MSQTERVCRKAKTLAGAACLLALLLWPAFPVTAADLVVEQVQSMNGVHNNGGAAAVGGQLYVWSGLNAAGADTSSLEVYNPATNSWAAKTSALAPRRGVGEFQLGGYVYSIGGENPSASFHNDVTRYNPATNSWATMANFPRNASNVSFNVVSGTAYGFGGRAGYGATYSDLWQYNAQTDNWTAKANMPYSVMCPADVAYDGKLYLFGGMHKTSESSTEYTSKVQIYDPALDSWQYGADAPWAGATILQAVAYNSAIWVFDSSQHAYQYIPGTGAWSQFDLIFPTATNENFNEVQVIDGRAYFTNLRLPGGVPSSEVYRAVLPEPATLSLLALGGLAILRRRRKT